MKEDLPSDYPIMWKVCKSHFGADTSHLIPFNPPSGHSISFCFSTEENPESIYLDTHTHTAAVAVWYSPHGGGMKSPSGSAAATHRQARALMDPNKGVSSPAPPVQQPKSSFHPPPTTGFGRILFWNWSRKGNLKRESVRKWAREAEQGAGLLSSPKHWLPVSLRPVSHPAAGLQGVFQHHPPHFIFYVLQLMQDVDRGDEVMSDEEWQDSGTTLYLISASS